MLRNTTAYKYKKEYKKIYNSLYYYCCIYFKTLLLPNY
jgi:hypothetical protein